MHKKLHVSYLLGFLFLISFISLLGAHYEKKQISTTQFPKLQEHPFNKAQVLKEKSKVKTRFNSKFKERERCDYVAQDHQVRMSVSIPNAFMQDLRQERINRLPSHQRGETTLSLRSFYPHERMLIGRYGRTVNISHKSTSAIHCFLAPGAASGRGHT